MYRRRPFSYGQAARVGGYALIVLGLLVLLGWLANLELLMTVLPGRIRMKANTAIGFPFAGIATVFLAQAHRTQKTRIASTLSAGIVIAVSLEKARVLKFSCLTSPPPQLQFLQRLAKLNFLAAPKPFCWPRTMMPCES